MDNQVGRQSVTQCMYTYEVSDLYLLCHAV